MANPSRAFWVLAAFLGVVFLTGGSSRADVSSLQWLRPLSMLIAAYGLITMQVVHWRQYRHLAFFIAAVVALIICHLVPLPPEIWEGLPGRGILREIGAALQIQGQWFPFSMVPSATLNALYSTAVPIAVASLAVQLTAVDHVRLLGLLILLVLFSAGVGLLQAVGVNLAFFGSASEISGVFANRNHQGILLAMLFPMLAVATQRAEDLGLQRHLAIITASAFALIALPLVIITGSRAGLTAAVIAMLSIPFVLPWRIPRGSSSKRFWAMGLLLGIALVTAVVWLTIFASRETALVRFEGYGEDLRYPLWSSIVDMLPTYFPWGSGLGSYVEVYQIKEPAALLRPTFSNHAHNEWLEIAMTAGVPGLILILWALALCMYAGWHAFRASGLQVAFSRLGLSMILILAFASTVDYPVRTPIMASVLAVAAIWAASFKRFGISHDRS